MVEPSSRQETVSVAPPLKELEEVGEVNWRSALASLPAQRRRRQRKECGGHIVRGISRNKCSDIVGLVGTDIDSLVIVVISLVTIPDYL